MNTHRRIVITGANGFIGKYLLRYFSHFYKEVVALHRGDSYRDGRVEYVHWDGQHAGPWMQWIDGADVLINLAGKSVNCRYNASNKKAILDSRINSTLILGAAVIMAAQPPRLWINSSTATIYKHSLDQPNSESSTRIGGDFSMGVAQQWESTFFDIPTPGTRKVAARTAIVLGKGGGVFPVLNQLAKVGLGGTQSKGDQMVSFIHEEDLARAIHHIIDHQELEGPVNLVSPNAVTNKVFMKSIREAAGGPFHFNMPQWMLRLGALIRGTEAELVLKSRWAFPQTLLDTGFKFQYPTISQTINELSHESNNQTIRPSVLVAPF